MSFILDEMARLCGCGSSLLFAGLATFGQIFELLIVKEKLLSSGEDKILTTIHTLEHSVLEFHGFPFRPNPTTSHP